MVTEFVMHPGKLLKDSFNIELKMIGLLYDLLEAWDNKMDEVEQIVFRIFISKTINNVIQLVSYMLFIKSIFLQSRLCIVQTLHFHLKFINGDIYGNRLQSSSLTQPFITAVWIWLVIAFLTSWLQNLSCIKFF